MKKVAFATAFLLSAATAVGLHGQTSTSSTNATRVTVTGCVQRASTQAPGTTTGTTGTAGTSVPDTKFVLTNPSGGAASTTGTTGTATAPSSQSRDSAKQYRLDDADESKVSSHVGEKVEITGTVEDPARSTAGTTGSTSASPAGNGSSPKLKVESVRVIASTCSD